MCDARVRSARDTHIDAFSAQARVRSNLLLDLQDVPALWCSDACRRAPCAGADRAIAFSILAMGAHRLAVWRLLSKWKDEQSLNECIIN